MPAAQFDTLRYVETLTTAGVSEQQAEAGAAALATAFGELKGEIGSVKSELKDEIASLRSELKGEIASLRSELKAELAELRSELKLIKWMNVTVVAAIISYVSKSFF